MQVNQVNNEYKSNFNLFKYKQVYKNYSLSI